jgi:heme A synthase
MAWIYYRHRRWVFVPSVLAFVMVIIAAMLGGATVLTELAWWFVLFHLGIAEILVACLIIAGVAGWHSEDSLAGDAYDSPSIINLELLTLATVAGVFGLILSGSYMVGYGSGSSCPVWPGCLDGEMMPQGTAFAIHMGHRIVAALVGVLLLVTSMVALSRRSSIPSVAWSGGFLILVFGIQVMLGAATVWSGFTAETKAIHLSAATLVWVALILILSLI